jgi:hypothetical protein
MKTYTQSELEIELLKQKNEEIYRTFGLIYKVLDNLERNQYWLLGLMGTGFLGLLGIMAHGFKWII